MDVFALVRLRLALTLGAIGLVLGTSIGGTASATTPTGATTFWVLRSPSSAPSPRVNEAMVYDAALRSVVLFGGSAPNGCGYLCADTWLWNGSNWSQRTSVNTPPARQAAAIAYDSAAQNVVMFGGYGLEGILQDTWILSKNGWNQVKPATSPPARGLAQMAYDQATSSTVMFGGIGLGGALGDTWTWKNGNWTQQHPAASPSPRYEHGIAYDAATSTVVLFGGIASNATYFNDTWEYDGSGWTQITFAPGTTPSVRGGMAMTYDWNLGTVVLFGGSGAGGELADTWTYTGRHWSQVLDRKSVV